MPRVLFTAAARIDLDNAFAWYDDHAPEVAQQFRDAMREVVGRISENPKQFAPASRQTRKALLRRFPYLVIFREARNAAYVVAVFHTSRDPRKWRRRTA